ncbi:hypothetical protein ABEF95_003122 [Exophiala dermatitidis]
MVPSACAQQDLSSRSQPNLFQELAEKGEIHIDTREPPQSRHMHLLQERQVGDSESTVPTTAIKPTSTQPDTDAAVIVTDAVATAASAISTDTSAPSNHPDAVSTSISPTVTVVTTPLPSPFDTSIGSNFTDSSCPKFFSKFLSNSTFQSCVPISLLLQNSNSFFRAERSATLLTQTLDSACAAPLAICSPLMANLAAQLIDDSHCGQDFKNQNPLVAQAYAGLVAYEPIYSATCLRATGPTDGTSSTEDEANNKNSNSAPYCFTQAITNTTNSADAYVYYIPLGLSLPVDTDGLANKPSCTQCLRDTMKIFAGYAENKAQPLSRTYLPAATQVDAGCGGGFVATDIKVGSKKPHSNGARVSRRSVFGFVGRSRGGGGGGGSSLLSLASWSMLILLACHSLLWRVVLVF